MVDHGVRDHATWAASSTAANVHCAGRLAMIQHIGPQPESIHAARGTAAHQVSEKCLTTGVEPASFLGTVEKTKEHSIEVDEEIVASAEVYVGYVNATRDDGGRLYGREQTVLTVEQRFSLAQLNPPFDAGGTADAVVSDKYLGTLEVIDLKHGVGVVDVEGNPQLRTYALGALLANPGLKVDRITVTIVQPRAPHWDGRIRSETFHVADLIDWTTELLGSMYRARQAMDEFQRIDTSLQLDDWQRKWLRPGRCKWCPVEATCPANRRERLERVEPKIVERWFEDVTPVRNAVELTEAEQVAKDLEGLDALEDWIKARRAHAHALAERGNPPPGWVLVDSYGHRKWGAAESKIVADLKAVGGLKDEDLFVKKLIAPAAADKLVGAAKAKQLNSMWLKPVTGRTLVRAAATDRPAAPALAERYFQPEN